MLRLVPVDQPDAPAPPWGWHRVEGLDSDLTVHVLASPDDPPVIVEMRVSGGALHAGSLRTIPLGQIERQIRASTTGGSAIYLHDEDGDYLMNTEVAPLTRRADDESAEDFAQRVARVYRWHAARTGKPAVAMARDSGVPVGTVRRWIREARELGVLEKGTRGRAG